MTTKQESIATDITQFATPGGIAKGQRAIEASKPEQLFEWGQALNAVKDLSSWLIIVIVMTAASNMNRLKGAFLKLKGKTPDEGEELDKKVSDGEVVHELGLSMYEFSRLRKAGEALKKLDKSIADVEHLDPTRIVSLAPLIIEGTISVQEFDNDWEVLADPAQTDPLEFEQALKALKNAGKATVSKEKTGEAKVPLELDVSLTAADIFGAMHRVMVKNKESHSESQTFENLVLRYGTHYTVDHKGHSVKIFALDKAVKSFEKGFGVRLMVVDDLNPIEGQKEAMGIKLYKNKKGGSPILAQDIKTAAKFAECFQKDLEEIPCDKRPLWGAFFGETDNMRYHGTADQVEEAEKRREAREMDEQAERDAIAMQEDEWDGFDVDAVEEEEPAQADCPHDDDPIEEDEASLPTRRSKPTAKKPRPAKKKVDPDHEE